MVEFPPWLRSGRERHPQLQPHALAAARGHRETGADRGGALLHGLEPEATAGAVALGIEAYAIVGHAQPQLVAAAGELDAHPARAGVLAHVGERLLHDAQELAAGLGWQLGAALEREVELDARLPRPSGRVLGDGAREAGLLRLRRAQLEDLLAHVAVDV